MVPFSSNAVAGRSVRLQFLTAILLLCSVTARGQEPDSSWRPWLHFTPKAHWMNDPNGMVYENGIYHLFYQHHPYSSVWGPMHWGHATSRDLVFWQHRPIAIYPDSLGTIFSGSAVYDRGNSSGFGTKARPPLVAIFTQHDEKKEKAGRNDFQTQGIAYSLDHGLTWKKYARNPVIANPGQRDFRDPKLVWHASSRRWVLVLAAGNHVEFYSSPDLKNWKQESAFGETAGAHGGVWECPDLFTLQAGEKTVWVLIVNLNPGGPNTGSATQYFLGDFDGHRFLPDDTQTRWLDYGPDEYAGVTWSNTGNRRLFLGWMSNWNYANQVPTETWRSAMTIPRDLRLVKTGNEWRIASWLVPEMDRFRLKTITAKNFSAKAPIDLINLTGTAQSPYLLELSARGRQDFSVVLSNRAGEEVVIGYEKNSNRYFIDRTRSGVVAFEKGFASRSFAPRLTESEDMKLLLLVDATSVELFADGGLTVMTAIFFPRQPFDRLSLGAPENAVSFDHLKLTPLVRAKPVPVQRMRK